MRSEICNDVSNSNSWGLHIGHVGDGASTFTCPFHTTPSTATQYDPSSPVVNSFGWCNADVLRGDHATT
jgi:hypothetical protein